MFETIDPPAEEKTATVAPTALSAVKRKLAEHVWAAGGLVLGVALIIPDLIHDKFTVVGAFGLLAALVSFFIDVVLSAETRNDKISEEVENVKATVSQDLEHVKSTVLRELAEVSTAVRQNTNTLRQHQEFLRSKTTDNLTLIAFNDLLAFLPFYLAEGLGYFADEHIRISSFIESFDDQSTARRLQENAYSAVAICDPYMCVKHRDLRLVYPICNGIATWPMTLNWIGSTAATNTREIRIAAYKAPSTTHVLARFVARNVIAPLLPRDSEIKVEVIELDDDEASFGKSDDPDEVLRCLRDVLLKYDVVMLWEPHCEMALSLGARYLERDAYEKRIAQSGSLLYSGLVLSDKIIENNPTLPIRLRRGLDRAIARLQDSPRLVCCQSTLEERRLLNGFSTAVQESVLARLVCSMPKPVGSGQLRTAGWGIAAGTWASGMSAADNLRRVLVKNDRIGRDKLQITDHDFTDLNGFRNLIFTQETGNF